jgi:hypothetical protein
MKRLAATFVQRDYRHLECDVVFTAPYRAGKGRGTRTIVIYVLIEHQSKPEVLMPLRVHEYVLEIYRYQEREWRRRHRSTAGMRLSPVLPVVFYTGTRTWDSPGRLVDLVELGEEFEKQIPALEPLFVNLKGLDAKELVSAGGFFGRLLHLVQQRQAPAAEFEELLQEEVSELEALRQSHRERWLGLLSYLLALVYHDRKSDEHAGLQEAIEEAVQADQERREVKNMGKSMADTLIERGKKEGEVRGSQRLLLAQLREKFGEVPTATQQVVKQTTSMKQLERWGRRLLSAKTLEDVQIGAPS